MHFKTSRGNPKEKTLIGELELLQMVSKPNIRQRNNENIGLPIGVDCEIPHSWRGELNIPYNGVKTSP